MKNKVSPAQITPRVRLVSNQLRRAYRQRLYGLLLESRNAYPNSKRLRHKWVRARLAMGAKAKPRVKVGLEQRAVFARTTADAQRRSDFTALAPRSQREAGWTG